MPLRTARTTDFTALRVLFEEIDRLDGYEPLTEAAVVALERREGRGLLVTDGERITGFAFRRVEGDRLIVETAIHPQARDVQTHVLLTSILSDVGATPVWLWASESETVEVAHELGFTEERRLVQLVRPLPIEEAVVTPDGVEIGSFAPGEEDAIVGVNNAAFVGHPDNAAWDRAELDRRMGRPWFDPEGLLVARADDGLAGLCWTKMHPGAVGEIYIIGVHPGAQGLGLGRALTIAGLDHLHGARGATKGMLYTEGDNTAGLSLYRSLGFEELRVKRGLSRF